MTIDDLARRLKLMPPDIFAQTAEAANRRRGCPDGPKRRTGRTTRLLLEALLYAHAGLRVCVVAESIECRERLLRRACCFALRLPLRRNAMAFIQVTAQPPPPNERRYRVVLFDYSGPGRMSLTPAN